MKTALVTGGAQGIGKGIVVDLRGQGWRVAVLDCDTDALDELRSEDRAILTLAADTGSEAAVLSAFAQLRDWLDRPQLDLLVCNAGIANPSSGPIEDLALKDWRRWLDSHLTGAFLTVRSAVPLLRAARGSIITIGSTRALQSEPDCEAYAAAKGGLLAMTHALAVSLGPEIRANCILPGWIETGAWQKRTARRAPDHSVADMAQHPAGRIGRPEDIAELVAFLASPKSGFITGQHFVVDGGMTRRMIYAD